MKTDVAQLINNFDEQVKFLVLQNIATAEKSQLLININCLIVSLIVICSLVSITLFVEEIFA